MKAVYCLEAASTDRIIAHIFEHAYMSQLYDFLADNGHKYTTIIGQQCSATTYLDKILLQIDIDDKFDDLIKGFIAKKHAFREHEVEISMSQVECETGYRYGLNIKELVETCNRLGTQQFKNLDNLTNVSNSTLVDIDDIQGEIIPKQSQQDFSLRIINLCVDKPTITDRAVLAAINYMLAELLHIAVDKLGGHIHGSCNFHDCTDDAILYKANAIFLKEDSVCDSLTNELKSLLAELREDYADILAEISKDFFSSPASIDYAYNYLGVLGSSHNLQSLITGESVQQTLGQLYVDGIVNDNVDETIFGYDNIANYLLR